MTAYLDKMERLGYPMLLVLGLNLILTSLSKDYDPFVQNFNMYGIGKTIPEMHAMLKLAEKGYTQERLCCPSYKARRTKPVHLAHQGLIEYQKLNNGALDLYVGNGNTTDVEAIGTFVGNSLLRDDITELP
ncbi:hypothetical protein Tco_0695053 [Tanacetum coccineum]